MSATNSLNINGSGVVTFNSTTGVFTESALTQHDVLVAGASNAIVSVTPSTAGFVLTSAGVSADPTFQLNPGSTSTTYVNASPYIVLATDDILLMDTTLFAAPMSVVLPTTPTQDGKVWTIKDWSGSAATFNITITVLGGANIDGSSSIVLNQNYEAVSISWSVAKGTYSVVYDYPIITPSSLTLTGDQGTSITGSSLLVIADTAAQNSGSSVAFSGNGVNTLTLDVTDASSNTIIGHLSGNATLTSVNNVSLGDHNFTNVTSGSTSVAIGSTALQSTTADNNNIAIGFAALNALNGASGIVAIGSNALVLSDTQTGSTAIGNQALRSLVGGNNNTAIGFDAGQNLATGANNLLLGFDAGNAYTTSESSNVQINSNGVIGESNTLRIGSATGTGNRQLSKSFIFGINGNTVANTQMVTISSVTSQLGTQAIPAAAPTWVNVTGATQAMAVNTYYIANDPGSIVTFTPPATCAVGTVFGVTGNSTSGWTINLATNSQTFNYGNTVGTTAVASSNRYDSVQFVCVVANTTFNLYDSVGSPNVT